MKSRKLMFFFAAVIAAAFTYVTPAQAKNVWENPDNPCNKLSLGGDVRYRYETDSEDKVTSRARDRQRVRIRLSAKYTTGAGIEAGFRLATAASSLKSPHQTLGIGNTTGDAGTNESFGLDRGYVKYTHGSGFWVWGGKNALPAKQFSEAWWDGDVQPEGIALGFKTEAGGGKLKVTLAQFIAEEAGWDDTDDSSDILISKDETLTLLGLHYAFEPAGLKADIAAYNMTWGAQESGVSDISYTLIVLGAGKGMFKGGIEYFTSDADEAALIGAGSESSDTQGLVVHVRAKLTDMFGLRVYFYDMGAISAPVAQDDFPDQSNFTGTRIQLDINAGNGMKIDIRHYNQSAKNDTAFTKDDHSRIQANFNVKF